MKKFLVLFLLTLSSISYADIDNNEQEYRRHRSDGVLSFQNLDRPSARRPTTKIEIKTPTAAKYPRLCLKPEPKPKGCKVFTQS